VGYRLREILNGVKVTLRTQQGNIKAYKFNEEKLKRVAKKYGYKELHTKLPSSPSSGGIKDHKVTLENYEKQHVYTSQKLGSLGNSVCRLTKIHPHVDRCSHCQKVEVLHWQVETFKGEWGHICLDCYDLFAEIIQKRTVG
jgi:hypothetical protein